MASDEGLHPLGKLKPSTNDEYVPLLSLSVNQDDKDVGKKECLEDTSLSLQGQYIGYLTETILPFNDNDYVLVHLLSANTVEITTLTDNTVRKEMSRDKVSSLEETTLECTSGSESPFSAVKFFTELIKTDNTQIFDIALQQSLRDIAKKANILHLTAAQGTAALLYHLIKKFPEINMMDLDLGGDNLLHAAVANTTHHQEVLDLLLRMYPLEKTSRDDTTDNRNEYKLSALDHRNYKSVTPLVLAIEKDYPTLVKTLVAAGSSLEEGPDCVDETALHVAARLNRLSCLEVMSECEDKYLAEFKKMLVVKNESKMIPVMVTENLTCMQILLKHADIEEPICDELGPILHWAAGNDKWDIVRVLFSLKTPPKVDINNEKDLSPLNLAATRGFTDMVRLLIEEGNADVNYIGDDVGFTALNKAAQFGHLDVAKLLVKNGAGFSCHNMATTPLHSAVYGGQIELTKYFIEECKIHSETLNYCDVSPLYVAIQSNQPECLKILLEHNASPNQHIDFSCEDYTFLHLAVIKGETRIVKLLLQYGARVGESDNEGVTPVMLATKEDRDSLIPLIMSHGIILSKVDDEKNSVMHHAAINGAVNCVKYLVKRITNTLGYTQVFEIFERSNHSDKTPFNIALENRQEAVLEVFIKYAPDKFFTENPKYLHEMYDKEMYQTLKAVFDTMATKSTDGNVDRINMTVEFLDSNTAGQYPTDTDYNHMIPSLLHKMLDCPEVTLKYHPIVNIVINRKLVIYRWWYILSFIFFILFLLSLAYALIQASYLCDDQLLQYNNGLNIFRLICEIFCILCWILFLVDEVIEFIIEWVQKRHESSNSDNMENELIIQSGGTGRLRNIFSRFQSLNNYSKMFRTVDRVLFHIPSAFSNYIFGFNVIDLSALVCFPILCILRISGSNAQWTFASFTFILFSLRLFKYTRVLPALGAYVRSVFRVFVRDIPRFIVIVLITSISYFGGIHLAARQQPFYSTADTVSLNNQVCSNTSQTQLFWFNEERTQNYDLRKPIISSIIFLLDGGPGNVEDDLLNVNFLFVALYIIFAFAIIVVLLNILIAQLSETYSEIIKTNEFHYKMELVVNLELKSNLAFIIGKSLRKYTTIYKLEVPVSSWEHLKVTCPGKNMEQQVDEINDKLMSSEVIIKGESLRAARNQEWIEDRISAVENQMLSFGNQMLSLDEKMLSLDSKIDKLIAVSVA